MDNSVLLAEKSEIQSVSHMLFAIIVISAIAAYIWYRLYIPPHIAENWSGPGFLIGVYTPMPFAASLMSCVTGCFFLWYPKSNKRLLCTIILLAENMILLVLITWFEDFAIVACGNLVFFAACIVAGYHFKTAVFIFIAGLPMAVLGGGLIGWITILPSILLGVAMLRASFTPMKRYLFWRITAEAIVE